MSQLTRFQEVSERAARAGGAILLDWAGRFNVREKGPADLVTEADLASQEAVREILLGAFPDHGLLAEENCSIPANAQGYRWIVDPLDGTTNYVHGIAQYCVSIALEKAGTVLVGTIFDPVGKECFTAVAGQGAYCNGNRLQASAVTSLKHAMVAMSLPTSLTRDSRDLAEFVELVVRAQTMRRMGSSALNLCYLAAGKFDGYWSTSTKMWDIAAGSLLVREAGGIITNRAGGPFAIDPPHFIAASTPTLHAELSKVLDSILVAN